MKIYEDIKQGTDEWHRLRSGKFTASDFHVLLGSSETKKNLLAKKTAERLNPEVADEQTTTPDIERGLALEGNARLIYEMQTGNEVKEIAFCEVDEFTGCSPDGLVGDDGIIEIKCPRDYILINQVVDDKIKPEYYTQIQFNLMCLNRQWCDYIAYNINYPVFIKRIHRDEEYIDKIKTTLQNCIEKVQENIKTINEKLLLTK